MLTPAAFCTDIMYSTNSGDESAADKVADLLSHMASARYG